MSLPDSAHDCLDSNTIQGLVEGWLGDGEHQRARRHLEGCEDCRVLAAAAAGATAGAGATSDAIELSMGPGTHVGRYQIVRRLGAGGMGVVYQAYDGQLQRKIALKLLRPDRGDDGSRVAPHARLLREARAMAQLSHPNVVHVYDVGVLEDQVFVSMELVEGTTLRRWLRTGSPNRRAVVGLFVAAGRGLAAAHAAGLVHRDVKPDNVLIGLDGRARVTDFGLARPFVDEDGGDVERPAGRALSMAVTRTGALAGTPAYMAPEQLRGDAVDARADQFGFCVALYEALYGKRPFQGASPLALEKAVKEGLKDRPEDTIGRILQRGLAFAPEQRYPQMTALLDELLQAIAEVGPEPPRRHRRPRAARWAFGAALLVAAAGTVVAWKVLHGGKQGVLPAIPTVSAPPVPPTPAAAPAFTPPARAIRPARKPVQPKLGERRGRARKPASAADVEGDGLMPFER